ncbi:Uncharacterised protein [uncultured archaeon]|nr:Uncharacterised protein [uncultured archaeon]
MIRPVYYTVLSIVLLSTLAFIPCLVAADAPPREGAGAAYRPFPLIPFLSLVALVQIGVGGLAFILFLISLLAYKRDRRTKFLAVSISFLLFTLKGVLSLCGLMNPVDSLFMIPFSDSFDFLILLLLFIAVLKD